MGEIRATSRQTLKDLGRYQATVILHVHVLEVAVLTRSITLIARAKEEIMRQELEAGIVAA